MEKWNSRKVFIALVVFAVSTGLLWFDKIGMGEWHWVTMITIGGYLGGQAFADALAGLKK